MWRLLWLLPILSGMQIVAFAQSTPVEINEPLILHYVGKLAVIHGDRSSTPTPYEEIQLEVIVTPLGTVEYAHAIHGPAEYLQQAEELEMARRFRPFRKAGKAVTASIQDSVSIVPPEQWGTKQPFPEVTDWNSLRFTLERPEGNCLSCPAYRLEVRGDGSVTFEGLNFVPSVKYHDELLKTVIVGKYHGKISRQQIEDLLEKFRQADYFSLLDKYAQPAFDLETVKTSLIVDGKIKKVTDYGGLELGIPEAVIDLETALDEAAVAAFRAQGLDEQADKLAVVVAKRH